MAQPWQRRYLLWVVTGWIILPVGSRQGTIQSRRVLLLRQSLHLPFSHVYSISGRLARDETYSPSKRTVPPSMPVFSTGLWEILSLKNIGEKGSWLNSYPQAWTTLRNPLPAYQSFGAFEACLKLHLFGKVYRSGI